MLDAKTGEDAVIMQKGGCGWNGLGRNSQRNGSLKGLGSQSGGHAEGSESHRRGRGLRRGLHLCCCGEFHLGLGLSGAGWGGAWGRGGEGGGGAAA